VRRRRLTIPGAVLLLCLQITSLGSAAEDEEESQGPPVLRSGTAEIVLGRQRVTAPYDLTPFGPLFPLQPIVARLGGDLTLGPLGQMHSLTVDGVTALFGPGVPTLTVGSEIRLLSQPPRAGMGGLHVPVDLLEMLYGPRQGYVFHWDPAGSTFSVERAAARQLTVRPEIVHVQGVSTVVLTFSDKPRYRLREAPGLVEVSLTNDRLEPATAAQPPSGSWISGLEVAPGGVGIRHRPGAVMESYELESPYRLVFDFYRGTVASSPAPPIRPEPPARTRDLPGIHTIVIDPGHGGDNTGAISRNGVREKDITLPIAVSLKRALESSMPVKVILTRSDDSELELDDRSAIANQNKADLFISLHVNSSYGRSAHGAETFFLSLQASDEIAAEIAAIENRAADGGRAESSLDDLDLILWDLAQSHHLAESQRLARLVQEELNGALGLSDRGVKQAPFRVLRGAAMPAVLVELGFLSNPNEERKLGDSGYRSQLVDALVRATLRYRALGRGADTAGEPAAR
jgi:N-acetylmuramoyl-L-alanine amidase